VLVPNIGAGIKTYAILGTKTSIARAHYFPYLIGVTILVISILIITREWKNKAKNENIFFPQVDLEKMKGAGILLIFSLIYIILLGPLGFFIVTPVFMIICLWYLGLHEWVKLSLISILTTICVFLVFNTLMGVQLPMGMVKWIF
jgi:cellulose synthase/poly-beta-1,6-N-acetylglucosamine synthase-like glycosyltransferase